MLLASPTLKLARPSKFYPFYIQTRWKIVLTVRLVTARFAKWNPSGNDDEQATYRISWSYSPDIPNVFRPSLCCLIKYCFTRSNWTAWRGQSFQLRLHLSCLNLHDTSNSTWMRRGKRMGKRGIKRKANLGSWCKGCHRSLIHSLSTGTWTWLLLESGVVLQTVI